MKKPWIPVRGFFVLPLNPERKDLLIQPMGNVIPNHWKTRAKWVLVFIGVATLWMGWRVSQIGFNYDFESFFPLDDPETEFYLNFRSQFESDNDFLIVGVEHQTSIYHPEFLAEVEGYVEELEALPYIEEVISPTRLNEPVKLGLTVVQRPLLRWQDENARTKLIADSARIAGHPTWDGSFVSTGGSALAIQVWHKQLLSKAGCDSLANAITQMASTWNHSVHIAGRAVAQKYYVDVMQREVALFVSIGLVLVVVFLWVAFQSIWGVCIPLLVVLLSGLWTLGTMEMTGKSIDVMTIVLPTIIFVVGVSDVVHILSRYYEELRQGATQFQSILAAFKEVGLATFLTTLTTAVGFLTLLSSSVLPIRDFGVYAAAGVGIAYLLAFTLLPSIMMLFPAPRVSNEGNGVLWNNWLQSALQTMLRRPLVIAAVTLGFSGLAVVGTSRIEVNNVLLEDLAEDDPFRQEFAFFEREFAGVRPFELSIALPAGENPLGVKVQKTMQDITAYLEQTYGVGSIVSSDRILAHANRLNNGDQSRFHRVPQQQRDIDRMVRTLARDESTSPLSLLVNAETNVLRVFGKLPDLGAQHYRAKDEAFFDWFAAEHPDSELDLHVTGTARLIDLNIGSLASDMVLGLAIAFLIVALISGLMFRNAYMVIISLIPNVLPLLMIAGIMGWTGINLKPSTSIIFTIAFGIAVDDTIHFISKLRIELAKGKDLLEAVKSSFLNAGKAIIITSIILCGGFMTLSLSSFLGTFYIGVLISTTLLLAVLSDLFVLPWLVLKLLHWKQPKRPSILRKILRP